MAFGLKKTKAVADPRRDGRQTVALIASARRGADDSVEIEIEDLSASGFRARMPLTLRKGALLRVRFPNGRTPHARIVRREGEMCGCEFAAPLDAEELLAAPEIPEDDAVA